MSGKTGSRETGKKPTSTRRHDSLAAGASARENPDSMRFGEELNRKISGQRSKYKPRAGRTKNA